MPDIWVILFSIFIYEIINFINIRKKSMKYYIRRFLVIGYCFCLQDEASMFCEDLP